MSAEIEIDGGKDASAYKIIVTGKDLDTFIRASQLPETKGKSGEELVQALLAVAKGDIQKVSRFKDNMLQDGPKGESAVETFNMQGQLTALGRYKAGVQNDGTKGQPAVRTFYPSDSPIPRPHLVLRYKDGKLNDCPNGGPANMQYTAEGVLVSAMRFKDGLRSDGTYGEPAVRIFTNDGKPLKILRYKDGHLNDGQDGAPALQLFDDAGKLRRAYRYKENKLVKELDAGEIADYLKLVREAGADAIIRAANPAMKVRRTAPKP